jgi:hypothetical protein
MKTIVVTEMAEVQHWYVLLREKGVRATRERGMVLDVLARQLCDRVLVLIGSCHPQ